LLTPSLAEYLAPITFTQDTAIDIDNKKGGTIAPCISTEDITSFLLTIPAPSVQLRSTGYH
jgi:hypothetical protein